MNTEKEQAVPDEHPLMALVRETAWDIVIGLTWAALIVAIVLFSGVATQFAYVDF